MTRTYRIAGSLTLVLFFLLLSALPGTAAEGKRVVNINSADASQLALLPRIGPSVAQRILEFRKQNGAFKSAEDLMLVRGVGEKTFALIKPYVAVSGETTLKEKVKAGKTAAGKESAKDDKEGAR
jgi:competence protein ComEA